MSANAFDLSDEFTPINDDDDLPTNLRSARAAATDTPADTPAATAASGPVAGRAATAPSQSTASAGKAGKAGKAGSPDPSQLTPAAKRVYADLMAVTSPRPVMRPGLVESLRNTIETGTAEVLTEWTETSMFLSKSQLATTLRCEGQVVAYAANPPDFTAPIGLSTAIGIAAHRAIQMSHTHPGHTTPEYVRWAVEASCAAEDSFEHFWSQASPGVQSDAIAQITSRTAVFTTSWPPLADIWEPRFEESMTARVGQLKLSAKPDLVLGTPRPSGQQTMLICDLKSGSLNDDHADEAAWHALVATLRHGVAPFRSVVYSLAEGEWTDPADVDEAMLHGAAERVVAGVVARVRVLTEARPPRLNPDRHCMWCPVATTCPESAARPAGGGEPADDGRPSAPPEPPDDGLF